MNYNCISPNYKYAINEYKYSFDTHVLEELDPLGIQLTS